MPRLISLQKKLEQRSAGVEVQVKRAIDKLELFHPRSSNRCKCASIFSSGACRTGISREDKQNSQLNGQPRESLDVYDAVRDGPDRRKGRRATPVD